MKEINSIDLWTEQKVNHYECFNGCFFDGVENGCKPFDSYKIIKNCNCVISCDNDKISIANKHHAIVFYNGQTPVRLMVINKDTDVEKCVDIALNQFCENQTLGEMYQKLKIKYTVIDLKQKPITNKCNLESDIDVGSCDRWALLYSMLKGSYTETESHYGNFESCKYEFIPNLNIEYNLVTDAERFLIKHKCAFINDIGTRLIPIQENSKLTTKN